MATNTLDIDYKKLNIDDCFKEHYIVPDYQREYVWEEKQIEQFLSDIENVYSNNPHKPYFMGMTVVFRGNGTLELIDGQQRITTFFILLCALTNIYKERGLKPSSFEQRIYSPVMDDDGEEKDAFVLELQYEESTNCLSEIFHGKTPNEIDAKKLSKSDNRLFDAYKIIRTHFIEYYPDDADLKKIASYFFKHVHFVQIEAKDISDALKIFETINERGVGLNPMDLLKNMIFMQEHDRDNFSKLNKEWKKIIQQIASINEKPLRFLRYFITATYDITDKKAGIIKGILPEDNIYPWLTENDEQCRYSKDPFGFVGALTDGVERYVQFVKPNSTDLGNEYLLNIQRLAGSTFKSHIVLLLAAKNMDDETIVMFKQILESVIYYYIVNRVKTNETEKIFAAWCPKIRKIKHSKDLKKFVKSEIIPQVKKWISEKDHHRNFLSLNYNSMQIYRLRFILTRISKYVDDIRAGGKNYADVSKYYDSQYEIEHIMPQTCDDKSAYKVTEEEYSYYINILGNLTLLEKSFNASLQNSDFKSKCEVYKKSNFYLTSSINKRETVGKNTAINKLNKKLSDWDRWDKDTIDERQEVLYQLSEEIWNLDDIVAKWKD